MHYGDFINTKDKIKHLLASCIEQNIYGLGLIECIKEFGEDITHEAAREFKAEREYLEKQSKFREELNKKLNIDYNKYNLMK